MNIYDFDNTILKGDSSKKFILYTFFHHPIYLLKGSFKALKALLKKNDFGIIKGELFSFVKDIPDLDNYIDQFVLKNLKNIKKFYLENQKDNDTIISASFDFLINPFCKYLKIKNVIATKYDIAKGNIVGKNCKGEEKIKRFREIYPNEEVNEAYSDSLTDKPMFEIAKVAYLVKGEKIIKYETK